MTTETLPADLLARLQGEVDRETETLRYFTSQKARRDSLARIELLQAAIESLAANRGGEVVGYVPQQAIDALNAGIPLYLHPPQAQAGAGDGVALIAAERQRHMAVEGWTPEHDDEHAHNELATAAACYAAPELCGYEDDCGTKPRKAILGHWPWGVQWWKPGDRIRELVKAGALIAAEIDRLKRAALEASHEPE